MIQTLDIVLVLISPVSCYAFGVHLFFYFIFCGLVDMKARQLDNACNRLSFHTQDTSVGFLIINYIIMSHSKTF